MCGCRRGKGGLGKNLASPQFKPRPGWFGAGPDPGAPAHGLSQFGGCGGFIGGVPKFCPIPPFPRLSPVLFVGPATAAPPHRTPPQRYFPMRSLSTNPAHMIPHYSLGQLRFLMLQIVSMAFPNPHGFALFMVKNAQPQIRPVDKVAKKRHR